MLSVNEVNSVTCQVASWVHEIDTPVLATVIGTLARHGIVGYTCGHQGMTLLLMGSAEALPQEPATKPVFMEDMSEQQLASAVSTLNSCILLLTLYLTKIITSPSVSQCYLLSLCFSVSSPSVSLCYLLTLCFSVLSSHPLFLCVIFSPSVSLCYFLTLFVVCVIFSPSVSLYYLLTLCLSVDCIMYM